MKIVVTTPTGNIGSKLAPILLDRGAEVTVIARHPDKLNEAMSRRVKVVKGEHSDPGVLKEAVRDADALFVVVPPPYTARDPLGEYRRFGEAAASVAKQSPTLHVVLLSSVGANWPEGTGLILGLRQAEETLRSRTKNFTALRANFFMENVLNSLGSIIKDGAIYGTVSPAIKTPQIATADIAAIAADVLLERQNGHHVIDAIGPEEISFDQVAHYIGTAAGKAVHNVVIPPDAMENGAVQSGLSRESARELVQLQQALEKGMAQDLEGEEQRRGQITFPQFVRDVFVPAYQQAKRGAAA